MKLTEQFRPFTEEDFAAAFQKEVKTGDFREILTWKTNEGIDVSPFYHGESNSKLNILSHGNDWEINDEIVISDTIGSYDMDQLHHYLKNYNSTNKLSSILN